MAKPLRVLVVEDSEDDTLLVTRELHQGGFDVSWERVETREAMAEAVDRGPWDLILSDFRMPRFSAPEALALHRERGLETPFIIVSGTVGEEQAVESLKAGAHDFFLKDRLTRLCPAVERELREAESRRARRRAEEELRASEARFKGAFASSPIGMALVAPDGRWLEVNPALCQIVGYPAEELRTRTSQDITHPDDLEADLGCVRQMLAGEIPSYEMEKRYLHRQGRAVWVLLSVSLQRDKAGPPLYFISQIQDISDRRRAETERRESKARLEEAQRIAHLGSWEHDLAAGKLRYSDEMYRLLGVKPEDFAGTMEAFVAHIHPDDRATMAAFVEKVLGGDSSGEVDLRVVRPDGTVRRMQGRAQAFFDPSGKPSRVAGSLQDVTERWRDEQALRMARTALDQAADMIVWVNREGGLVYANDTALRLLGHSREELLGMSVWNVAVGLSREAWPAVWEAARQTGSVAVEDTSRRKDGSTFPVDVVITHVAFGDTELQCAILRDVSERRQMEAQLRQAQKLEAIGQLAGGVAHDFNNILGVITGYGEFAQRQLGPGHPVRARVDQMMKAASRAADLTRQLLAFSRKQVMRPKLLDLNGIVADIDKMLGRLIGEDVDLVVHAASDLGMVKADPGQIEQIILNLAVNARDAMPKGGRLTIETANVDLDEEYAATHPPARSGRYVMLAVSDTGIGMDEETQQRIFEPFFTTKPEGEGTGLGLATVYGIVKQSGGHIWVYSEPGRGTTFKVYLPRVDELAEVAAAGAAPAELPRGQETILLVEDTETLREVIRETLEDRGYTVLLASNGEEALALARAREKPIDLLLTDVVMPKLGGGDLAKWLSALRPGMRVLYMSGYTNGAISQQGVLGEGVALLEKPFTGDKLARAVRQALDRPIRRG